jgi:hypothetical protein
MRRIAAVAAAAVMTTALALFAGAASAGGPGNGGGSGNGQGGSHAQAGTTTQTKSHAKANGHAHVQGTVHAQAKGHAQAKTHVGGHSSSTTSATAQGVKPSAATTPQHDTHAPAASTKTKLYGNGKTAGQIAMQNGASATTVLHGPGNSQPHKLTACPARHEIDVHALKSHRGNGCASKTSQQQAVKATHGKSSLNAVASTKAQAAHVTICHATGSSNHPFVVISPSASGVVHGHLGHQVDEDVVPMFQFQGQMYSQNSTVAGLALVSSGCKASAPIVAAVAATQQATQSTQAAQQAAATPATPAVQQTTAAAAPKAQAGAGVKGSTQAASSPKQSGVQNASRATSTPKATTGSLGKNLPFTGLPLWIALAAAGGLILAGGLVRLGARPTR